MVDLIAKLGENGWGLVEAWKNGRQYAEF